jgi:hypothetical protein
LREDRNPIRYFYAIRVEREKLSRDGSLKIMEKCLRVQVRLFATLLPPSPLQFTVRDATVEQVGDGGKVVAGECDVSSLAFRPLSL